MRDAITIMRDIRSRLEAAFKRAEQRQREVYELTENQLAWLEALESGRYTQAKDTLYDDGAFCCLGVAADLAGWDKGNLSVVAYEKAERYLNLRSRSNLIRMNDVDGFTFKQIAKIVRRYPAEYFIA